MRPRCLSATTNQNWLYTDLRSVYTYRFRSRLRQIYTDGQNRMGSKPNLSAKQSVTIDTMINFDGDGLKCVRDDYQPQLIRTDCTYR